MPRAPVLTILFAALVAATAHAQEESSRRPSQVVLHVPFAAGERQTVWRGPGDGSHADVFNRHAVDFSPLAVGHPIVSASVGRVVWVKQDTAGPTGDWRDNNEVAVALTDGEGVVVYLHLACEGAVVAVDDELLPGDPIGFAGNTGNSEAPHLHIDVRKGHRLGPSIPWRFDVVPAGDAIAVGRLLESANVAWRGRLAPWQTFEQLLELACAVEATPLLARLHDELTRLDARGPAKVRRGAADDALLAHWRALRDRVAKRWQDAAAAAGARLDAATDDEAVPALAVALAGTFAGTPAAKRAETLLAGLESAVRSKAQRAYAADVRRLGKLRAAFDVEWQLARAGRAPPFDERARKKLDTAYERAVRGWPDERAERVRRHVGHVLRWPAWHSR